MDYLKAFDKIKTAFDKIEVPASDDNFAIQVNLTDSDCSGIFYIEMKDKQLFVEPYDYYDNNAIITSNLNDFIDILDGKIKPVDAALSGKISINGDEAKLVDFFNSFKLKSVKKAAPKKAVKKVVKKTEKKAVKKAEKSAVSKKAAAPKVSPAAPKAEPAKKSVVSPKTVPAAEATSKATTAAVKAEPKKEASVIGKTAAMPEKNVKSK